MNFQRPDEYLNYNEDIYLRLCIPDCHIQIVFHQFCFIFLHFLFVSFKTDGTYKRSKNG